MYCTLDSIAWRPLEIWLPSGSLPLERALAPLSFYLYSKIATYLLMLTIAATDCLVPSGEDSALTATREGSATTCLSAMWLPITYRSGDHKTVLGIRSDGLFGSSGSD